MLFFVKLGELLVITSNEVTTPNSLVVNVWLLPKKLLEDGLFVVDNFYLYCVQQMHLEVELQCINIHHGWCARYQICCSCTSNIV
jgi:hypothetical protein